MIAMQFAAVDKVTSTEWHSIGTANDTDVLTLTDLSGLTF